MDYAGRPPSGTIQQLLLSYKARYKLAVRDAYNSFEEKVNDDLRRQKCLNSGKPAGGMQANR